MSARLRIRWMLLAAPLALVVGCEAQRPLGAQCDVNSECNAPLVCRLDRCRLACRGQRDCPVGLACVLDGDGLGSCLLEDEALCTNNSECADTLVCRFGRCTNECDTDDDCVAPTRCLADPVTNALGCFAGTTPPSGCQRPSDCDGLQLCFDGRCRPRCLTDRDCGDDERCRAAESEAGNECVPRADAGADASVDVDAGLDGGARDAGPDASATDAGADAGPIQIACSTPAECVAPRATTDCVDSFCVATCDDGWTECDGDYATGCEADASRAVTCGGSCTPCAAGQGCAAPPGGGALQCTDDAVLQIVAGSFHTCALRESGRVLCWGIDGLGQLGDGDPTPYSGTAPSYPAPVLNLDDVSHICAGTNHSCAVQAGVVYCWGGNQAGELGSGGIVGQASATPIAVPDIDNAVEVACGGSSTCARLQDGTVRCFGSDSSGQLGNDNPTDDSPAPVVVVEASGLTAPLSGVLQLSAGTTHFCARLDDSTVRCWGNGDNGRIGDGTASFHLQPAPVSVMSIGDAIDVSAGGTSTCVVRADRTVECFGEYDFGQLGDNSQADRATPGPVPISDVAQLALGSRFACALLQDGTAQCWGRNHQGQSGDGGTTNNQGPVAVMGLVGGQSIDARAGHVCARTADGGASCWGSNGFGELGDGQPGCCTIPSSSTCDGNDSVCSIATMATPVAGL